MGTFTTKLKLGGKAFVVEGGLDPCALVMTVGQIRVIETLPKCRSFEGDVCYKEEYMCVETGVGCGTVYTYGKSIFATEEEARFGVIARQQEAYKQRAERDAARAKAEESARRRELAELSRLREKYEAQS